MLKLRSAGVDSFRYLLDHPLVCCAAMMLVRISSLPSALCELLRVLLRVLLLLLLPPPQPISRIVFMMQETGVQATRIAAVVWGSVDGGGGLVFEQQDIDKLVLAADQRGQHAIFPLLEDTAQSILSLTVSDVNKDLLLGAGPSFIPMLVDGLFLDPEHPRSSGTAMRGNFDFQAIAPMVQRVSRVSSAGI